MRILILGASSGIASAFARLELLQGSKLFLAARSPQKIEHLRGLANERGLAGQLRIAPFDAGISPTEALLREAFDFLGGIDIAVVAFGTHRDQRLCQQNEQVAAAELADNFLFPARWLGALLPYFEAQGTGTIAVISSVAGDRGRQSNYVYGAAKAGLSAYAEGLRHRLFRSGVRVLTIKPGFVDTPMTSHLPKNFLFASPEKVAADISRACRGSGHVLYTPWFWRWIMMAIRWSPRCIFFRTRL